MKSESVRKILSISRDPSLLDRRKRMLEGKGYKVLSASSLETVFAITRHETLNLVILSFTLSDCEKETVKKQIAKQCHGTPVLELNVAAEAKRDYDLFGSMSADAFLCRVAELIN